MKKYPLLIILVIILFGKAGVATQTEHLIVGRTMGTTYHLTVVTEATERLNGL